MKSERLRKLETELQDLEQWLKLGLVPKKEIERHKEEISSLKTRIGEEKERLQYLKESGMAEEFTAPKKSPAKTVYPETPTFTEFEIEETEGLEAETEGAEYEATEEETVVEEEEEKESPGGGGGSPGGVDEPEKVEEDEDDEEDPFSDRNRWRRGGIIDPDASEW